MCSLLSVGPRVTLLSVNLSKETTNPQHWNQTIKLFREHKNMPEMNLIWNHRKSFCCQNLTFWSHMLFFLSRCVCIGKQGTAFWPSCHHWISCYLLDCWIARRFNLWGLESFVGWGQTFFCHIVLFWFCCQCNISQFPWLYLGGIGVWIGKRSWF